MSGDRRRTHVNGDTVGGSAKTGPCGDDVAVQPDGDSHFPVAFAQSGLEHLCDPQVAAQFAEAPFPFERLLESLQVAAG